MRLIYQKRSLDQQNLSTINRRIQGSKKWLNMTVRKLYFKIPKQNQLLFQTLTNMRVIMRQHTDTFQFHLSPVPIVQQDLDHFVRVNDHIVQVFNGTRKQAVVGPAPVNTNPGTNWQLIFVFWFHLIDLKEKQYVVIFSEIRNLRQHFGLLLIGPYQIALLN